MMAEMPLALFTTFAPVGAGAFITLAFAFSTTSFSDEQYGRIDKMTAVPVAVLIVGFICAFFHLANPLHAFGVFAGVGSSPLSNELVVGCIFAALAVVYWVLAVAGKLSGNARKGFVWVVAVMACVFACFTGAAYMMDTIASWNTPAVPVQILGFALLGGAALGLFVLACAGVLDDAKKSSFRTVVLVVAVVGLVLGVAGLAIEISGISDMSNSLTSGSDLLADAVAPMGIGFVLLVAATVGAVFSLRSSNAIAVTAASGVVVLVGVLACRIAFYAIQLSVGLYVS